MASTLAGSSQTSIKETDLPISAGFKIAAGGRHGRFLNSHNQAYGARGVLRIVVDRVAVL